MTPRVLWGAELEEVHSSSSRAGFIDHNPGKLADFYDCERTVMGKGTYGSVRKATLKGTGCVRAVKTFFPEEDTTLKAFQKEVDIMQSLDHPHIIRLYEVFAEGRNFHLVMELCSGGELFDVIQEHHHFTEVEAAHVMEQVLKGVAYMHGRSIVHRDLKPENFLCLNKGPIEQNSIKIIDFGVSSYFKAGHVLRSSVGTPLYVAPEVLQQSYNEVCDVWSCGVVLFLLLSGRFPFPGETGVEVMRKVRKMKYRFRSKDWRTVSDEARSLIEDELLVLPERRSSAAKALRSGWIARAAPRAAGAVGGDLAVLGSLKAFSAASKFVKLARRVVASQMGTDSSSKGQKLQALFESLDEDKNGLLSVAEMRSGLVKAGFLDGDIQSLLTDVDVDGSGEVDYSEFLAFSLGREELVERDLQNVMRLAFRRFDRDGDGKISKEELKAVLDRRKRTRGECDEDEFSASSGEATRFLREADEDGDGHIDFEEFRAMLCSGPDSPGLSPP